MTTELYEVFSLEEGDTIILNGDTFYVQVIEPTDDPSESLLTLVDDEGFQKSVILADTAKVRVLCESVSADVL